VHCKIYGVACKRIAISITDAVFDNWSLSTQSVAGELELPVLSYFDRWLF